MTRFLTRILTRMFFGRICFWILTRDFSQTRVLSLGRLGRHWLIGVLPISGLGCIGDNLSGGLGSHLGGDLRGHLGGCIGDKIGGGIGGHLGGCIGDKNSGGIGGFSDSSGGNLAGDLGRCD